MKIKSLFLLLALCAVTASAFAATDSVEKSRQKRQALEKDIAILKRQIGDASKNSAQAISALNMIQAQKVSREALVAESDRQIAELNREIAVVSKELQIKQAVLDTLQGHYNRLVLGAYKNRDIKIWYMYILASENVSQAFRRFGYFKGLSSQIHTQARKVEQAQAELNEKKTQMIALKEQAVSLRAQRAAEVEKLKAEAQNQQKIVNRLKRNTKEYKAALKAKQEEMKALDKQIAKMLQEAANAKKSAGKNSKPVDMVLAKSFENNKGKLPWPVDGPVTEHYGAYQNKELKLSLFNNGINIACDPASPVKAVFDGVVSNIMVAPGYGKCILVQHGNYYTSYCKIKNSFVKPGDKVKTGQTIGDVATIMGRTQLYFLVWKKQYLDPEVWLRAR